MSIKGQLQKGEVNKFGFFRVKVAGEWYGADKKGQPSGIAEGDIVEFEPYTNDRGYASFKFQSLKKVAGAATTAGNDESQGSGGKVSQARSGNAAGNRDTYWTDKAAIDAAKEPKIAYFAALERATGFVALAFQTGALASLAKAKETAKLDILTALVDEQTQRILVASYAQQAPKVGAEPAPAGEEATDEASAEDGAEWK